MAMRGPLRRELRKYRRGQCGVMPGFRGRKQYVTGAVPGPVYGGYPTDLYMWNTPRDYHPNMNAPAAQSDEYIADPDWDSHHVPPSQPQRLFLPFPEHERAEVPSDYEQTKAFSEFFLKFMEAQYQPLAEGEEPPTLASIWQNHMMEEAQPHSGMEDDQEDLSGVDVLAEQTPEVLQRFWDITAALGHLQDVFPEDHPDIVNLRAAAHEILEHPELLPQPEDFGVELTESKLGTGDPYAMDTIDEPQVPGMAHMAEGMLQQHDAAFEQVMQMFDHVIEAPALGFDEGPGMASSEYSDLEAVLGAPEAGCVETGGLEQMLDQEDPSGAPPMEAMLQGNLARVMGIDVGFSDVLPEADGFAPMTPEDEIGQAIDMAAGQPEMEQEPDPFQMQYDPFPTAQQLFDQQMQYMDNPFMMPGMGPMPGPAPGM